MNRISLIILLLCVLPASASADLGAQDIVFAETYLDSAFEATTGHEFAGSQLFADLPSFPDVWVEVFGIGFCQPASPNVAPDPNPVPPLNAWGCQNDITVQGQLITATEAEFMITIANAYGDFHTTRDEAPACFECLGFGDCGTVAEDGYLLYSVTATMRAMEVIVPSGRELHVVAGSVVVDVTRNTLVMGDGCLETLIGIAGIDIDASIVEAVRVQIEAFNLAFPPVATPVEQATWGNVKSVFRDR